MASPLKPALFHTLCVADGGALYDWDIMAVTTIDAKGVYYGRYERGGHGRSIRPGYTRGHFAKFEHAAAARNSLLQIVRDHAPAIERARAELDRLTKARDQQLAVAISRLRVDDVAVHNPTPAGTTKRRARA